MGGVEARTSDGSLFTLCFAVIGNGPQAAPWARLNMAAHQKRPPTQDMLIADVQDN